jgi:hypothetical protein
VLSYCAGLCVGDCRRLSDCVGRWARDCGACALALVGAWTQWCPSDRTQGVSRCRLGRVCLVARAGDTVAPCVCAREPGECGVGLMAAYGKEAGACSERFCRWSSVHVTPWLMWVALYICTWRPSVNVTVCTTSRSSLWKRCRARGETAQPCV